MEHTVAQKDSSEHREVVVHSDEKDDVSDMKTQLEGGAVQDEHYLAVEKSLTRKLDMTLLPMLWILYLFNYLDRNNIAYVHSNAHQMNQLTILIDKLSWILREGLGHERQPVQRGCLNPQCWIHADATSQVSAVRFT